MKAPRDTKERTESFAGVCGKTGRFAKSSLDDMRLAGHKAAKALARLCTPSKPVHKTCPSWGVTACWRALFQRRPPKTTERWAKVTCPMCLAHRPHPKPKE